MASGSFPFAYIHLFLFIALTGIPVSHFLMEEWILDINSFDPLHLKSSVWHLVFLLYGVLRALWRIVFSIWAFG
ncbi:unnamed protein product [Linum trigynum]|uniref:Uncharacterized protein n=1 Tax=Linum trigynum TaxID=586398 RepID=A0AAV2EAH0_9ROSI